MPMLQDTQVRRANDAGFHVKGSGYPEVQISAKEPCRGFIKYVLLHVGWVCDECGERVPVGEFMRHIRRAHSGYNKNRIYNP